MRTEVGKIKLADARRELKEIQPEYLMKKSKVFYYLILERLQEIRDKAQELAKEGQAATIEELYGKLQVLR